MGKKSEDMSWARAVFNSKLKPGTSVAKKKEPPKGEVFGGVTEGDIGVRKRTRGKTQK